MRQTTYPNAHRATPKREGSFLGSLISRVHKPTIHALSFFSEITVEYLPLKYFNNLAHSVSLPSYWMDCMMHQFTEGALQRNLIPCDSILIFQCHCHTHRNCVGSGLEKEAHIQAQIPEICQTPRSMASQRPE